MAAFDLADLLDRAQWVMGGGTSYFTDAGLTDVVEEALNVLAVRLPDDALLQLNTTAEEDFLDTGIVDISSLVDATPAATPYLRFKALQIKYSSSGDWVWPRLIDVIELASLTGSYAPTEDDPVYYHSENSLVVLPIPGATVTDGAKIFFIKNVTVTDVSEIPIGYRWLILEWMLYRAKEKSREQEAQMHLQVFNQAVSEILERERRLHQIEERGKKTR